MNDKLRASLVLIAAFASFNAMAADRTSANVAVSARVMPFLQSDVKNQASTVYVTADDVERGWVEVPAAATVNVRTNDRMAFVFRMNDPRFSQARVAGLDHEVVVGKGGGFAPQPIKGGSNDYQLDYRLELTELVTPGTYPLPVSFEVRSLR